MINREKLIHVLTGLGYRPNPVHRHVSHHGHNHCGRTLVVGQLLSSS